MSSSEDLWPCQPHPNTNTGLMRRTPPSVAPLLCPARHLPSALYGTHLPLTGPLCSSRLN